MVEDASDARRNSYMLEGALHANHLKPPSPPQKSSSSAPETFGRAEPSSPNLRSSRPSTANGIPNGTQNDLSNHKPPVADRKDGAIDGWMHMDQSVPLRPGDTAVKTRSRSNSLLDIFQNDEEIRRRLSPVFDSIARTMQRLAQRRARVYYEKVRVEEQAEYGRIKRDEAASINTDLKFELEMNPPDSTRFNVEKTLELTSSWEAAYSQTLQEEKTLRSLNAILVRQEQRLQEAEGRFYNHMTGEYPFKTNDLFHAVFDKSSTGSASSQSARSLQFVALEDLPTDREGSEEAQSPSASNDREWVNDYEYRTVMSRSTRHDNDDASVFLQRSPTWNFDGQTEEQRDQARKHSDASLDHEFSDSDTSGVGDQFQRGQDEIEMVKRESLSEMEAETHMRRKRKDDPVIILATQDGLPDVESDVFPSTERQSLGYRIGHWIVQLFACSWLELARFVPLVSEKFPVIETIVMTIGYVNLDILIHRNWTFDDVDIESSQMRSIIPSVSSVSDDIPRYFHQIMDIGSEQGPRNIHHFQVSRDRDRYVGSSMSVKTHGSARSIPSLSRIRSPSDRLSHMSKKSTPPTSTVAPIEDDNAAVQIESDIDVYIEHLDLNEQYFKP